MNDEAVSPVIGVILMVAITVVLAAVVFVLVNNLSANTINEPANLSFSYKDSDHTFTLIEAPSSPVAYDKLTVKDNGITQTFTVNGVRVDSNNLEAGDVIAIDGLVSGSHSINFIINNRVIYEKSFIV